MIGTSVDSSTFPIGLTPGPKLRLAAWGRGSLVSLSLLLSEEIENENGQVWRRRLHRLDLGIMIRIKYGRSKNRWSWKCAFVLLASKLKLVN